MIELKIQVSSPDMLRDTILAFGSVMQSGLIAPGDQVKMTASDTTAPDGTTEIEAWIDQAPDPVLPAEFAAEPEPEPEPEPAAPKKRGRPPKAARPPSPAAVDDVGPPREVGTEEDEPEAEGAVEPPEPPAAPKPVILKAVKAEPIEYTRDDVRAAVKRVMDAHGPAAAVNRLETIGYKKASDVPEEDFERAINALLGA